MQNPEIDLSNRSTVEASFDKMATELFNNFVLLVNDAVFRLIDFEFYYYSKQVFEDIYAHQHEAQLSSGKWYFHGSGMDITIGNGQNHGGILIRAIAEISSNGVHSEHYITREIHGPLNVKTAISAKLHGAFDGRPDNFFLKIFLQRRRRLG